MSIAPSELSARIGLPGVLVVVLTGTTAPRALPRPRYSTYMVGAADRCPADPEPWIVLERVAAPTTTAMTTAAAASGAIRRGQRRPGVDGPASRAAVRALEPRGYGSPVPTVTSPDDVGHGQRPGLAGAVFGQLPQFVVQVRHWNTSRRS